MCRSDLDAVDTTQSVDHFGTMSARWFVLLVLAQILLIGCDDPAVVLRPDSGMEMDGPAPTYYADVAPLIQRECLACHIEGGIGPFLLTGYDEVVTEADSVVEAVMTGYMPPWLPDPACREFDHQRGLTADERAIFQRWFDGGMRQGDIADLPPAPPAPPAFEATDIARMAEPYLPDATAPDDYRCFLLDYEFENDVFITGRSVVPGAQGIVHHVLSYAISPEQADTLAALDAADEGPGYECFSGPIPNEGGDNAGTLGLTGLGGWVPGQLPFVEREGRAIFVPAGSRIVMQMHYNLLAADPTPDSTELHLQLTTTEPEFLTRRVPLAILDLNIPAGMPSASHTAVFRNYTGNAMNITTFSPHMHMLGRTQTTQMVPRFGEDGPTSCMIDVPEWDFNWQQNYRVRAEEPINLEVGAGLEVTCVYDNSPSHQPVVNGEQIEPRDVSWGEGSLDEMCINFVQHEVPWNGPPSTGCDAANACLDSCATNDTQCMLGCQDVAGTCRVCMLRATLSCAQSACFASYIPAGTCMQSCITSYVMIGGSYELCMQTECPDEWPAVRDCVSGIVDAGTCDTELTACGITR